MVPVEDNLVDAASSKMEIDKKELNKCENDNRKEQKKEMKRTGTPIPLKSRCACFCSRQVGS
jgi:hypothetical protein